MVYPLFTTLVAAMLNFCKMLNLVFIHRCLLILCDDFVVLCYMLPVLLQCCKSLLSHVIFIGHLILQKVPLNKRFSDCQIHFHVHVNVLKAL